MRKDPTEFRERFAKWKAGEQVYENGLPMYGGGKSTKKGPYVKGVVSKPVYDESDIFYQRMQERQAQLDSPKVQYTRQNNNPVKFDEQGNLVDQVTGETGTMMLPEIRVTPKRYDAYHSTFDPNVIRNFTDWIPVVGDIGSGIDFKNAIQNKDYITASVTGAGFILPPAVARILRNPIRKTIKYGKRFFNDPAYTYATRSGLSNGAVEFPEKYASRFADQTVTPTGPEKAMFSQMYSKGISKNQFMSSDLMNYSIQDYIDAGFTREQGSRIQQMFLRNPEYAKYIETKGLQNTNPLSQTTVDDFLKQQFTSLRGVHAPDKESAIIYLTHGEKGRNMPGGDRLGTDGGVYTSNSTNVADRFKNPEFGTEDGWVGRVVYPYDIRRDIPIEDQLEQYRKMVFPAGEIHPMYGTESYFRELQNAKNGQSIALESDYVGRASRGVPGQERAYLPIKKESHPILNIESVSYYPNQTNQNGRWGYGMNAGDTDGLFIPRQMNAYSDFIRSAKTFLSPRIKRDQIVYSDRYKQASDLWKSQARKRDSIVQKIKNTNDKINLTMLFSPVVAAGLGIYKKIKSDEKFYDSPEFEQFLSDPNYEKYLNIDDGSFWKLSSFDKLERKYKRKYQNRIGDK